MGNLLNAAIPAIDQAFYSNTEASLNKTAMLKIYETYKAQIDSAAALTYLPKELIIAFIFIESSGKPDRVSSAKAVGLMQVVPAAASDILVMEKLKGRLSAQEAAILTQYLGKRFTEGIMKMKFLGDKKTVDDVTSAVWVTADDLKKPMLNILIGCIYLGILIAEETNPITKAINFHSVVIRYNRGYFADNRGKDISSSIVSAVTSTVSQSKDYILKLLGTNGALETLLKNPLTK